VPVKAEEVFRQTVAEVQRIFPRIREHLERDRALAVLLKDFRKALALSEEAYRITGAYRICAECAAREESTCCGKDMELHVSRELLIVNLLLGVSLPRERTFPKGCFFLVPKGCALVARPLLCRNFFCPWFRDRFPHRSLVFLQEAQGKEADLLFHLEIHLKNLLLPHRY